MEAVLTAAEELIAKGEADLSPLGKPFCDQLTAEQWRVVRGKKLSEDEIQRVEGVSMHLHFADKPHGRQRLYELAKIAKLDNILSSGSKLGLLISELEADVKSGINTPSAYAMLGASHIAEGRYDLGVYYFNKSNSIVGRNNCVTAFMSLSRALPALASFEQPCVGPKTSLAFLNEVRSFNDGPVAVVAGNALYINRFLENYARSIAEKGSGSFGGIHVHWVKEKTEAPGFIDVALMKSRLFCTELNVTFEEVDEVLDKKSYFAQSRFLVARRLSEHYRQPLLITDLDFQLSQDPSDAFKKLSFIDVSFLQHKIKSAQWAFPWLRSMAGSVWVNNTEAGREFFRLMELGFASCYNAHWFNWGVDQNLLTSVLEYSRTKSHLNFASFSEVAGPHLFNVPMDLKAGIKSQLL
ncbi:MULTISPECIES: hypothetical protein [Pseudomonas]|uniref:Uncharacterized protein n=1 Tax=Pseudomonas capeferrum TaxID=1495066 RepID=A0ABY7RDJ1_9PSED|nr:MULTISPECIES: hypothetical protein [Pseudomonas]MUT51900.1 hypothetical protein [Pseudomonas sp. TDA1]WCI01582.1 hypothetical protein PMC74_06685 [Pseudomonas capeferrum]